MIRAILRHHLLPALDLGVDIARELAVLAFRRRLGITALEQRVRDLEILADRAARTSHVGVRLPRYRSAG